MHHYRHKKNATGLPYPRFRSLFFVHQMLGELGGTSGGRVNARDWRKWVQVSWTLVCTLWEPVYWEFLSVHISGSKCSSKSLGKWSYRLTFRAFRILFLFSSTSWVPFEREQLVWGSYVRVWYFRLLDVSNHTALYERRSLWRASTVDGCNGVSASTPAYGCASLRDSQIFKRFLGSPHDQDDA